MGEMSSNGSILAIWPLWPWKFDQGQIWHNFQIKHILIMGGYSHMYLSKYAQLMCYYGFS